MDSTFCIHQRCSVGPPPRPVQSMKPSVIKSKGTLFDLQIADCSCMVYHLLSTRFRNVFENFYTPSNGSPGSARLMYVKWSSPNPIEAFVTTGELGWRKVIVYGGAPPVTEIPHGWHVNRSPVTFAVIWKGGSVCGLVTQFVD